MEKSVSILVKRNVAAGGGKQEEIGKVKREEKVEFIDSEKDQGRIWSRSKTAVIIVLIHCFFSSTVKHTEEEEEGTHI